MLRNEKGITLIALVITIVVLLILAGISIAMVTGDNGILTQAARATEETENAQVEENDVLYNYEQYIEGSTNGGTLTKVTGNETTNTTVYDSLENKIVVPAGFRVVNPGDNVEDGIVIEDVSYGATAGSQFVWIPVGTGIKKKDGTMFDIMLGRYVYKKDGTIDTSLSKTEPTDQLKVTSSTSIYFSEALKDSSTANTHAKDIERFISKAESTGGYYIARYEARTTMQRTGSTDDNGLTQVTVKQNNYVYNYVTQDQAATLSQEMYNDSNFESDLINSYGWDIAINFLQMCDDRNNKTIPYSRQTSLNTSNLAPTGTTEDVICNIYDIASNCYEWTTESVYENSDFTCTLRGGIYSVNTYYSADRHGGRISYSDARSFFPTNFIFIILINVHIKNCKIKNII